MNTISAFTNNVRALANDLDQLLVTTSPETYPEALIEVLTKYNAQDELGDLIRG